MSDRLEQGGEIGPEDGVPTAWGPYGRPPKPRAFVSFAQNLEDVRLWRVFHSMASGFYVDVGAGDPQMDSVTKRLYDAGWCGINIEPGPAFEQLRDARSRDVNLRIAIAEEPGTAEMWISSPSSGLSGFARVPEALLPEGFDFERTEVECRRLSDVLADHAPGRTIDLLKVDVEGAERQVLASVDLTEVRPTVVCVEAITPLTNTPSHAEWEPLLLDAGFVLAAFDGLNRFYVPEEKSYLQADLAYPMSILDGAVFANSSQIAGLERELQALRDATSTLNGALVNDEARIEALTKELLALREHFAATVDLLVMTHKSLSWRITKPLRMMRRAFGSHLGAGGD